MEIDLSNYSFGLSDLCWCQSNLPYGYCHHNREFQEPPPRQKQIEAYVAANSIECCMAANLDASPCSATIVRAHSIPRNSLLTIAARGDVLSFFPDSRRLLPSQRKREPKLASVSTASTHRNFCAFHDNMCFRSIDDGTFVAEQRNCTLIAFRALCSSLYLKEAELRMVPAYRNEDKGMLLPDQVLFQHQVQVFEKNLRRSLSEIGPIKLALEEAIRSPENSRLRYHSFCLSSTLPFACSGCMQPDWSFSGEKLQDYTSESLDYVFASVLPSKGGTTVGFAWLDDHAIGASLLDSLFLVSEANRIDSIVRFCFSSFENLYASPNWWNDLTIEMKEYLISLANTDSDQREEHCPLKPPRSFGLSWQTLGEHFTAVNG